MRIVTLLGLIFLGSVGLVKDPEQTGTPTPPPWDVPYEPEPTPVPTHYDPPSTTDPYPWPDPYGSCLACAPMTPRPTCDPRPTCTSTLGRTCCH